MKSVIHTLQHTKYSFDCTKCEKEGEPPDLVPHYRPHINSLKSKLILLDLWKTKQQGELPVLMHQCGYMNSKETKITSWDLVLVVKKKKKKKIKQHINKQTQTPTHKQKAENQVRYTLRTRGRIPLSPRRRCRWKHRCCLPWSVRTDHGCPVQYVSSCHCGCCWH